MKPPDYKCKKCTWEGDWPKHEWGKSNDGIVKVETIMFKCPECSLNVKQFKT